MPRYAVQNDAEHGCCWSARIVDTTMPVCGTDGLPITKSNGLPWYSMVCECDAKDAQMICNAMNTAISTNS